MIGLNKGIQMNMKIYLLSLVTVILFSGIGSVALQASAGCPTCDHFAQDNRNNPTYPGTGQGSKEPPENNPHSPISNYVTYCAEHSYSSNPSPQLPAQCY